jgi:hypothetical protein
MMYYGCNKCKQFAIDNPSQFFENEGRCPDCFDDHESMINHIEWQKAAYKFHDTDNRRGAVCYYQGGGITIRFTDSISGEINS